MFELVINLTNYIYFDLMQWHKVMSDHFIKIAIIVAMIPGMLKYVTTARKTVRQAIDVTNGKATFKYPILLKYTMWNLFATTVTCIISFGVFHTDMSLSHCFLDSVGPIYMFQWHMKLATIIVISWLIHYSTALYYNDHYYTEPNDEPHNHLIQKQDN